MRAFRFIAGWTVGLLVLVTSPLASKARADDPPQLQPAPDAPAHIAHAWTSAGGLRYTWVLPEGYKTDLPRDLVVICHGTGLDYRWGHANYKPGPFRRDDIVVSVDGPTKVHNGSRLFLGRPEDAEAFAAFLKEMRETFSVKRSLLYGHSQGGFFVVYFAGEHPELVDGVVAHASGAWNWSKTEGPVQDLPIAFMHGTFDPVVTYRNSVGSRDAYQRLGFKTLLLRRMARYNHWPNGDRAAECLDWCVGMKTADAAEALAVSRELLRAKPKDEYGYECPPAFAAAAAVLARVAGDGPNPIAGADESAKHSAREMLDAIDAEGARHVEVLREQVRGPYDLKIDGGPWLGHLIALDEDFRGVRCVEDYMARVRLREELAEQAKQCGPIFEAWYGDAAPDAKFRAVADGLPACFLVEGMPVGMGQQMEKWKNEGGAAGIDEELAKKYDSVVGPWRAGLNQGFDQYARVWKAWPGVK